MIVAIYSSIIIGVFAWVLFWIFSLILYFVIFGMLNRGKGIKSIISSLICVEFISDILWIVLYTLNPWYLEYGVGVTYGFFVWCFMLLVGGVVATLKSRKVS